MTKRKSQKKTEKKPVSEKTTTLLAIMGIIGLILLAFGVYAILAISTLLGVSLIVLGVCVYVLFVIIEKKLKML